MSQQLAADQQLQDFVITMLMSIFCACGVLAIVVIALVRIADFWVDHAERIKGDCNVLLNVLGFVVIVVAEWTYRALRRVWEWAVPDYEAMARAEIAESEAQQLRQMQGEE